MSNDPNRLEDQLSDPEAFAEATFASLVAEVPAIEPRPDFVERTVSAAWRIRSRRRMAVRLASVGAALVAFATVSVLTDLHALVIDLVARCTVSITRELVWILTWTSESARWLSMAEQISTAVNKAASARTAIAAIGVVTAIVLLAVYGFQQLMQTKLEANDSPKEGI